MDALSEGWVGPSGLNPGAVGFRPEGLGCVFHRVGFMVRGQGRGSLSSLGTCEGILDPKILIRRRHISYLQSTPSAAGFGQGGHGEDMDALPKGWVGRLCHRGDPPEDPGPGTEGDFFVNNLLVRIHSIIVMVRWTGLAPWELDFPFPGSLTSTFLWSARECCITRLEPCLPRQVGAFVYRGTSLIRNNPSL